MRILQMPNFTWELGKYTYYFYEFFWEEKGKGSCTRAGLTPFPWKRRKMDSKEKIDRKEEEGGLIFIFPCTFCSFDLYPVHRVCS